MPTYYGTQTNPTADPTSNTLIADSTDASYSVQLTTGVKDKLIIDICGASANAAMSDASCIRIRCIINDGELDGFGKFTTNAFQYRDISSVANDIALSSANEGKALVGMESLPFTFRTLENASITPSRAFRVVLKAPGIKNGDKVSVYVDACNNATKATFQSNGFSNTGADVKFNQDSTTRPYALINAGPSGTGANAGIPAFSARLLKKAGSTTDATLQVSSGNVSLFSGGGEGIGLKTLSFSLSPQNINGNAGGDDDYFTLTSANEKVVDGVYLYETNITGGATKSYYLQCIRVADDFDKTALVEQFPVPNELLLVSNQPVNPTATGTNITVDGTQLGDGEKAVVSFKGAGAPEGYQSIERFSAYYASRDQIDAMPRKSVKVADFKTHVPSQVVHIERADISYAAQDSNQKITITGLANTTSGDNGSRYAVLVTASTKKDGAYIESSNTTDLSATKFGTGAEASMGFVVQGCPDAPIGLEIVTGSKINTTAAGNDNAAAAAMEENLKLVYFDNVDQNGADYTKLNYAIIRASDLQYVGVNDFVKDGSFTDIGSKSFSGTSLSQTAIIDAINSAGVKYIYKNGKWADATAGFKDASNGTAFAIKMGFENAVGQGDKSDWVQFTPSSIPNAQNALFAFDPSGDDKTAHFGNFTSGDADWELDQADITSNTRATKQGLDHTSGSSITFQWSLKNKTEKAKGAAGKVAATLDGGAEILSSRFNVQRSTAAQINGSDEPSTMTAARTHGQSQKDVNNAKSALHFYEGGVDAIFANQGRDNTDKDVGLKYGQRYDISAALVNANGHNENKAFKCLGFAPMRDMVKPKNFRQSSTAPILTSGFKAVVDLSYIDMSGVADHGGHLLTAYDVKMTQTVNGITNVIRPYQSTNSNKALDASNDGIIGGNTAASLNKSMTVTSTADAKAGYPITVTVRAEANADAYNNVANNLNTAEAANQFYNKNRANVRVEGTPFVVAGPGRASGQQDDEVMGLSVENGDANLTVQFTQPENAAKQDPNKPNGGDPRVMSYHITAWDISQSTLSGVNNDTEVLAVAKYEHAIAPVAGQSVYTVNLNNSLDGVTLRNGNSYLIQVQTRWGYGEGLLNAEKTVGVYSTAPLKGKITDVPRAVTGGYKWFTATNADNLTSPLKGLTASPSITGKPAEMWLPNTKLGYSVPSGKPTIEFDLSRKVLKIRDNGNALNNGALIQLSPVPTGSTPSIFSVDLLAGNGTNYTSATAIKDNLDTTYTIKSSVLGSNWANEQNIVIVDNDNGSDYKLIGI